MLRIALDELQASWCANGNLWVQSSALDEPRGPWARHDPGTQMMITAFATTDSDSARRSTHQPRYPPHLVRDASPWPANSDGSPRLALDLMVRLRR